jgi:hypothetical protein
LPMIYVSREAARLLDKILEHLRENTDTPGRILKTDVISTALVEYAKKLGLKVN